MQARPILNPPIRHVMANNPTAPNSEKPAKATLTWPQKSQAWLFRVLIGSLSLLSLKRAHQLGTLLGKLLYRQQNSVKRVAEININIAYSDWTQAQRQALLKAHLIELAKTATELGPLWRNSEATVLGYIKKVDGEAAVIEAFARGKGVIVLSPHLGSWEAIGPYWSSRYSVTYLYRPPRMAAIEDYVVRARTRTGAKLAPTDVKGVVALRKALKNNEMIGILPDQDPGPTGGVYAPFFGYPARTMVLVAKLAAKTGCAVFFNYAERLPNGQGFHLHIIPADLNIAAEDEVVAATALNQGIEACVHQCPSQYQWNYKRFKHPPGGGDDVYRILSP